jgi:glutamate synthase domain-containing protein 2
MFQQRFFESIAAARKMVEQYQLPTKIIAAGVIVTEFELLRAIALGADACFNVSDILVATGSVTDRLKINRDAQSIRIANFHRNTIAAARSLMSLCRYEKLTDVNPADFYRKINGLETKTLKELMDQTDSVVVRPQYVNLN